MAISPVDRACILSVLRLSTVAQSTQSTDSTWDKAPSGIYGAIEPNVGIFCACVVTLRPLFNKKPREKQRATNKIRCAGFLEQPTS